MSHPPSTPSHPSGTCEGLRRQGILAAVFIFFSSASYFFIEYDRLRTVGPIMEGWARDVVAGLFPAPEQYRVGIPLLALGLQRLTHLRVNQTVPLLEAMSYAAALTLLYRLLRASDANFDAERPESTAQFAMFLAAAQLPLLWILPWERHETLPTALYLAAVVSIAQGRRPRHWAVALGAIAVMGLAQAMLRADIPVIAGVALLIAAGIGIPFSRPRSELALIGAVSILAGCGVQLYLARVAYPLATYPATVPKFQLLHNLNVTAAPEHLPVFFTALLPFFVTIGLARRFRSVLSSTDKLILLLCLLYLPIWVIVGLILEIRIFVPFLLLASPVIAKLWTAFLWGQAPPMRSPSGSGEA